MVDKIILVNPHWQGGGDIEPFLGTREIEKMYLQNEVCVQVPVSCSEEELILEKNIIGQDIIGKQLREALNILKKQSPERIFTVGGSCDADIPAVSYLNNKLGGNLTVLWLDAHGDLNTPESSESKLFYGMPLRTLLGDCPELFTNIIEKPLQPNQAINVGGRDFDIAEENYIRDNGIAVVRTAELAKGEEKVLDVVRAAGNSKLYIHLDLDVLAPEDFSHTPLPSQGGIPGEKLIALLYSLKDEIEVVGMGLFEYTPASEQNELLGKIVRYGVEI